MSTITTTKKIHRAYPVREQIRITDMYSFFQMHFANGYEFSGETHNFWECLYVLNGEVCVSADVFSDNRTVYLLLYGTGPYFRRQRLGHQCGRYILFHLSIRFSVSL